MAGKAGLHALGWLGKSVAVYIDDDELFAEALATGNPPPPYSRVVALARNLALFPVILGHGFRRLLP